MLQKVWSNLKGQWSNLLKIMIVQTLLFTLIRWIVQQLGINGVSGNDKKALCLCDRLMAS